MRREELVAETAITLLVERGMRGLTHRAVDEAAGLPPGSTSNVARTRAALLDLTLARLTMLEEAAFPAFSAGDNLEAGRLAELTAGFLHFQLTEGRRTSLARYELALEATRRPELRKVYDEIGRRFREAAIAVLASAGSADPVRHGGQLVAFAEGVIFDALVGAGTTPTLDELRSSMHEVVNGMLSGSP
ncbi:TetR/AcrR family transcriptional regulator [Sphaerisporangium fuscum]|uniref:TetR/AcrR family transcriptional regulator n=1 Tax=Sphaerisporangium fuscum TaxID=2835868 RepID=UPI001BDC43ED|nr:TetR/AcrR family transcriptional regulator [Sphaerisporangium fuscum]